MKKPLSFHHLLIAIFAVSSYVGHASTWLQTGTSDWNTPTNWAPSGVPGTADTAIFNSTPAAQPSPNLSASDTISLINLATSGWTISASNGSILSLSSTGTSNASSGSPSAIVNSSTTGTNTISAPINFTAAASGTQTIFNLGTLTLSGPITSTNAMVLSLNNAGTANLTGNIGGGASGSITLQMVSGNTGATVLSGNNTFAAINLGGGAHGTYLVLNSAGALGTTGVITFSPQTGGIAPGIEYTANNTTDYSSRFSTATSTQDYSVDTNGQNVTWATALNHGSYLYKQGTGTLTVTAATTTLANVAVTNGTIFFNGATLPGGWNATLGGGAAGTTSSVILGTATPSVLNYAGTVDNGATVSTGTVNLSGGKTWSVTRGASTGADLTVSSLVTGAANTGLLTKTGTGTVALTNTGNTFAGVVISQGAVQASSLANGNAVSSIGKGVSGTAAGGIVLGSATTTGTLSYVGATNASTDRLFTLGAGGGGLDSSGAGTVNFSNTGSIAYGAGTTNRTLTLSGTTTGNNTLATLVGDAGSNGGTGITSVTKSGAGTWVLSATANSYTGATAINAGGLVITGSGYSGGVTVGNGSAVATLGGSGTINGAVVTTAASGSNVAHIAPGVNTAGTNFGVAGTLNLGSNGLTVGSGTNFDFDLTNNGSGTNDQIDMNGGALTIGGLITFNFNELNGSLDTANPYILVDGFSSSTGFNPANVSVTGLSGYTAAFTDDVPDNAFYVTFSVIVTPAAAYFNGQGTDLGTFTNFDTDVSSGTVVSAALGSTTNVAFNANRNSTVSTATLNSALDVNSVTFGTGSGIHSGMTINGTGTMTIEATGANGNVAGNGITVNTGGGNNAINTALVLGNDQTWTVTDSTSTLTVGGSVSGAHMLTKAGQGSLLLRGSNTHSGGTAVTAGALLLANGGNGSATGSGALTVGANGTIGGGGPGAGLLGTSIGSSFNIQGKVIVGNGTDATSSIKIAATGSGVNGTLASANLTFNLNSSAVGQANLLDLGSTNVTFSNTTLTLNLLGSNVIGAWSPYTLITDAAGFNSATDGLTTQLETINGQTYDVITGGLSIAGNAYFGTPTNGFTTGYYSNSFLYINGDNINVEVVPEPGTWALMLGGLVILVFIQRRRKLA